MTVKEIRNALGMSVSEFAKVLGVRTYTVYAYEVGLKPPWEIQQKLNQIEAKITKPIPAFAVKIVPPAAIAFMKSPFVGKFKCINGFDHNLPMQFIDKNGLQVNYLGNRVSWFDGHEGYDWLMPVGVSIYSVGSGRVEQAGEGKPYYCPVLKKDTTGLYVVVSHTLPAGEKFASYYAHLSRVDVKVGERVNIGQCIGLSGNSGCSTVPHLHFSVYRDNYRGNGRRVVVDPYGWGGSMPDPWEEDPRGGVPSVNLWLPGFAPGW